MKIVVTGTRGIPEIQGGVETHCQELYPRLAAMGHDITIIRRSSYIAENPPLKEYKGVKLVDVYAPRKKSIEAILHTFLAVIKAKRLKPDILHIHAIGPGLMVPFARMLGLNVVTTNHGPDYDRKKWGKIAGMALRTGEKFSARWSNQVIVISHVIAKILADKYRRTDTNLIYNGANPPDKSNNTDYIQSLGLTPQKYVVALGRFVEEKGFHDLIEAFSKLAPEGIKLAIAGDADHEDAYSRRLKEMAHQHNIVLTGFIRGEKMNQLMSNAALFCLPSYHEGLPIVLLEAMSYGLDVAVSDIPANRIPELLPTDFYPVGNTDALAKLLAEKLNNHTFPRIYNMDNYNWDVIARQTERVYQKILEPNKTHK